MKFFNLILKMRKFSFFVVLMAYKFIFWALVIYILIFLNLKKFTEIMLLTELIFYVFCSY